MGNIGITVCNLLSRMKDAFDLKKLDTTAAVKSHRKKRICIIGAGPCGLSALHSFIKDGLSDKIEIVCFEKQKTWGGQWTDEVNPSFNLSGEYMPEGSNYRNMWSGYPKENMEYPDYSFKKHFGKATPSFPSRGAIFDYISGRALADDVVKYIKFSSIVRWLAFDQKKTEFTVHVEDVHTCDTSTYQFDYLIIATGHFSNQHVPYFPGMESFRGPILHSHQFKDPKNYKDMNILLIGSSMAAHDIGAHCLKDGAQSLTFSYRSPQEEYSWPDDSPVASKPELKRLCGNVAHFIDGTSVEVDTVILCTGYNYTFPFLEGNLKLKTVYLENLFPAGLYKGVVWIDMDPHRLFYLGMQEQFFTFSLFDIQATWVRDVILNKIALPSKKDMISDSELWILKEKDLTSSNDKVNFQALYMKDLLRDLDFPYFDIDLVVRNFERMERDKKKSIIGYRDNAFPSAVDGTMGTLPTHRWFEGDDNVNSEELKEITEVWKEAESSLFTI